MAWLSNYEAVEVGGTTLHRMITERAAGLDDCTALIDGATGQTITYATLALRVESVAAGLAARGFGAGDVLALLAPNMPQWAGVALGAMAVGGTVSGANLACTERELTQQLSDSGTSILVTIPPLVPAALTAAASAGVKEVVVLGEAEGATPIIELIASEDTAPEVALDPDTSVALLPYSSGTTGPPKGVMLTHTNLATTVRQLRSGLHVTERDVMLAVAPFFHVMGFIGQPRLAAVLGRDGSNHAPFRPRAVSLADTAAPGHARHGAAANYGSSCPSPDDRRARPILR